MKKGGAKEKEEGTERGREEKDRGTGGELKQYPRMMSIILFSSAS
jgi:hypothetical protein